MYLNGRDPITDGWIPIALSGWMSGPVVRRGARAIPDTTGVIPSLRQTPDPRTIRLRLRRYLSVLADRDAAQLILQDRLSGLLHVRFDDAPTRVVRCVASLPQFQPVHEITAFSIATIEAEVLLTCYDGASYDTEPRVLALSTTGVEIPLGSLPSAGVISWGGAWTATTSRTLIIRDHGGVARVTQTLTAPTGESLGATDFLELLTAPRYVSKVTSAGTRTAEEEWVPGVTWIALDPAWQHRTEARSLTLEISAGTAQITYRKAYAL